MNSSIALPLAEVERRHIITVLRQCGDNRTRAAAVLGLSIRGMRLKLAKYKKIDGGKAEVDPWRTLEAFDLLASQTAILDGRGRIVSANRAWERVAATVGDSGGLNYFRECEAAADRGCMGGRLVLAGLQSVSKANEGHFTHVYESPYAGGFHWLQLDAVPNIAGSVLVVHTDVTLMEYDASTRLPNHRLFDAQLKHSISNLDRVQPELFIVVLTLADVERAVTIFGYDVEEAAIRHVAEQLRRVFVDGFSARLSAREFGVIRLGPPASKSNCAVMNQLTLALQEPILFEGQITGISAKVGTSSYPQDSTNSDALLLAAKDSQKAIQRTRRVIRYGAPSLF